MTPVVKFFRNAWEKHVGTFAEGPQPPTRLASIAEVFAKANPKATVAEWMKFAVDHAESAYRAGYVRGFERSERMGPEWSPEEVDQGAAILERMEEIELGNVDPFDPSNVVPIDGLPQENAARTAIAMNAMFVERDGQRRGPSRK